MNCAQTRSFNVLEKADSCIVTERCDPAAAQWFCVSACLKLISAGVKCATLPLKTGRLTAGTPVFSYPFYPCWGRVTWLNLQQEACNCQSLTNTSLIMCLLFTIFIKKQLFLIPGERIVCFLSTHAWVGQEDLHGFVLAEDGVCGDLPQEGLQRSTVEPPVS